MKNPTAILLATALALSGCATAQTVATSVASAAHSAAGDVNAVATALSSSDVQQAQQALVAGAQTASCTLADAASLMTAVAAAEDGGTVNSSDIAAKDATSVYVGSATVCMNLGGTYVQAIPAN